MYFDWEGGGGGKAFIACWRGLSQNQKSIKTNMSNNKNKGGIEYIKDFKNRMQF